MQNGIGSFDRANPNYRRNVTIASTATAALVAAVSIGLLSHFLMGNKLPITGALALGAAEVPVAVGLIALAVFAWRSTAPLDLNSELNDETKKAIEATLKKTVKTLDHYALPSIRNRVSGARTVKGFLALSPEAVREAYCSVTDRSLYGVIDDVADFNSFLAHVREGLNSELYEEVEKHILVVSNAMLLGHMQGRRASGAGSNAFTASERRQIDAAWMELHRTD